MIIIKIVAHRSHLPRNVLLLRVEAIEKSEAGHNPAVFYCSLLGSLCFHRGERENGVQNTPGSLCLIDIGGFFFIFFAMVR